MTGDLSGTCLHLCLLFGDFELVDNGAWLILIKLFSSDDDLISSDIYLDQTSGLLPYRRGELPDGEQSVIAGVVHGFWKNPILCFLSTKTTNAHMRSTVGCCRCLGLGRMHGQSTCLVAGCLTKSSTPLLGYTCAFALTTRGCSPSSSKAHLL